jgi:hypothetical protein
MRWTAGVVLSIVAAVIAGVWTGSVWYGLLAFFVAAALGRALRTNSARRAVWPAAATGFAFLYAGLGLATWATFFAAWACASVTRWVLR